MTRSGTGGGGRGVEAGTVVRVIVGVLLLAGLALGGISASPRWVEWTAEIALACLAAWLVLSGVFRARNRAARS
jgi:hypothetical protein